jgi:ribosomal-protein-alanine N-acetyltransferase
MASDNENPICRLRPFRPGDLEELVRLDQRCFRPAIAYDRLEMLFQLTSPGHFTLLAIPRAGDDPSLLGFVIAESGRRGRKSQIVTLDVHPGVRRRGIGRRLLEAAEQRLAALGSRTVQLQVAEDNTGAREFYQGLGYRPAGHLPAYYADGTNAVEMVKSLSGQESRHSEG